MNHILERCINDGADVLGFGISNVPLTDFLLAHGVKVTVHDGKPREKLACDVDLDKYEAAGVRFLLGDGYMNGIGGGVIFRTPGIRPDVKEITSAVAGGAVLTSEMELFYSLSESTKIAITGSDGKTTTTTLTHLLLTEALADSGVKVGLGGNIGAPLLPRSDELGGDDFSVTELSSFQLMTFPTPPDTAVITNVTPNHLNWHTGMEEYIAAKLRIIGDGCRRAVLNYGCDVTRAAAKKTGAEVIFFTAGNVPDDLGGVDGLDGVIKISGGDIVYRKNGVEKFLLSCSSILLPGRHNIENYMAALGAVMDYIPYSTLVAAADKTARTFGGVPHRLEFVREKDGIRCYNGSIDSTPTRTAAALSALPDKKISLICGGYDKHIPMEPLAAAISSHGGVLSLTLTGDTAELIKSVLDASNLPLPPYEIVPDFDDAVRNAYTKAAACGCDVLLLSPACASFDRFRNFEERGNHYKEVILSL